MDKRDIKKLKERSLEQLKKQIGKDRLKLRQEMANFYGKGDKKPKKIRQLKKDIAQTMTIIRQKEIEKELQDRDKGEKGNK